MIVMKDFSKLFATELSQKTSTVNDDSNKVENKKVKTLKGGGEEEHDAEFTGLKSLQGKRNQQDRQEVNTWTVNTILQLNATPFAIDVDEYKNPHSADNPTGDYKAAYRIYLLADQIPQFAPYYISSLNSVKKVYDNLITSASSQIPYAQNLIREAQINFRLSKLSGMGGIPDEWYPVYTAPSDWYDIVQDESNLVNMEIDMIKGDVKENEFITLNGNSGLSWGVSTPKKKKSIFALNKRTKIRKIGLKILRVDFIRPWFDFELLGLKHWEISGLNKEYFSNGKLENNTGIFPLITQSMLIGSKVSIEGDFHQKDMDIMSEHKRNSNDLSFGPFLLNTGNQPVDVKENKDHTLVTSDIKQIVGYISQLIPAAPCLPD
jgi:hypothetical protein